MSSSSVTHGTHPAPSTVSDTLAITPPDHDSKTQDFDEKKGGGGDGQ